MYSVPDHIKRPRILSWFIFFLCNSTLKVIVGLKSASVSWVKTEEAFTLLRWRELRTTNQLHTNSTEIFSLHLNLHRNTTSDWNIGTPPQTTKNKSKHCIQTWQTIFVIQCLFVFYESSHTTQKFWILAFINSWPTGPTLWVSIYLILNEKLQHCRVNLLYHAAQPAAKPMVKFLGWVWLLLFYALLTPVLLVASQHTDYHSERTSHSTLSFPGQMIFTLPSFGKKQSLVLSIVHGNQSLSSYRPIFPITPNVMSQLPLLEKKVH